MLLFGRDFLAPAQHWGRPPVGYQSESCGRLFLYYCRSRYDCRLLYDLLKSLSYLGGSDLAMIAIGFVTAFVVAYISVLWFLRFLNKSTLASFAYYRFVVAVVAFIHFIL